MYQPMFFRLPQAITDRFGLVRRYARDWAGHEIEPPADGHARALEEAEAQLGRPLPEALRTFYASGFFDWFLRHAGSREWTPPGSLGLDERTGSLTIMKMMEQYAIAPDRLDEPDPPVVEHKVAGPYSKPPFKVTTAEPGVRFSEFLVREALMMADDLVEQPDDPAALREPVYADGPDAPWNRAIRRRFSPCAVAPRRGGTDWTIYEGPDAFYIEGRYEIDGEPRFYALLTARTADRLADLLSRPGDAEDEEAVDRA